MGRANEIQRFLEKLNFSKKIVNIFQFRFLAIGKFPFFAIFEQKMLKIFERKKF